jgi:hypothetical protein
MSETTGRIQPLDQEKKANKIQASTSETHLTLQHTIEKRFKLSIVIFMACMKGQAMYLQEEWLKIKELEAFLKGKNMDKNLESGNTENEDLVANQISWNIVKNVATSSAHSSIQDREKDIVCDNICKEMKKTHLRGHHKSA